MSVTHGKQAGQTMVFLLLLQLSARTSCFSRGAPEAQCDYMTPKHGFQPQSTPPFAAISLGEDGGQNVTDADSRVLVTLRSEFGQFKGFLLRAEEEGQQARKRGIGTWWLLNTSSPSPSQYLHCHNRLQSALTHTDAAFSRRSVEAFWQPEADFAGSVLFRATVVEDYKTYWKDVTSQTLRVEERTDGQSNSMEKRRPKQRPEDLEETMTAGKEQMREGGMEGDDERQKVRVGGLKELPGRRRNGGDDGGLESRASSVRMEVCWMTTAAALYATAAAAAGGIRRFV